jgi:hypothetical protein
MQQKNVVYCEEKRERKREMPMQAQTLRLYPEAYLEGMRGNMSCCLGHVTEATVALLLLENSVTLLFQ